MDERSTRKWWAEDCAATRHEAVMAVFGALFRTNSSRMQDNLHHARLYSARAYDGLSARTYARSGATDPASLLDRRPKLTYNLVQSVIDTKVSKLAATKPRVQFLTEGGNWDRRQEAKTLTKVGDGLAYEMKLHPLEMRCLRDAEVFGDGIAFFYEDETSERVAAERVLPDELLVDDEEAFYGEPRMMMRWKLASRDVLLAEYADADEAMRQAIATSGMGPTNQSAAAPDTQADLVLWVEAWHLPSGKDAGDGCHVMCVEKATLLDEEYEDDEFPFAFLHDEERAVGFWGQGAAERLSSIQWNLNKTLASIENALDYGSNPKVLRRRGAKIPNAHIRRRQNGIDIIDVESGPNDMVVIAPSPVSPQLLDHAESLIRRGFEQEGVSTMEAQARKPAGLDSAPAQREFNDITSQRFMRLGQRLEEFHKDCIRLALKCAKRIADREEEPEEGKGKKKAKKEKAQKRGYKLRVPGKHLEYVDLKDITLPEDGYVMKAFPVSALPTTPAAKREELGEWQNLGLVDRPQLFKLLDFPDLEDHMSMEAAALDDIEWTISRMLEHGEPQTPEPYQDLQLGMRWVQLAYLRARKEKAPEANLQLLRDWMDQVKDLLDKQAAAAAPPAPPAGAAPPPGGLPPPGAPPMPGPPPGMPA